MQTVGCVLVCVGLWWGLTPETGRGSGSCSSSSGSFPELVSGNQIESDRLTDRSKDIWQNTRAEPPGSDWNAWRQTDRHINVWVKPQLCYINELAGKGELPLSDCRQDKEHPEVNPKNQNHLKDQLPQNCLPQVQSPVYHHGTWRQRSGYWWR